jgi:hypothetical protein
MCARHLAWALELVGPVPVADAEQPPSGSDDY